jgi:hypothetical protein
VDGAGARPVDGNAGDAELFMEQPGVRRLRPVENGNPGGGSPLERGHHVADDAAHLFVGVRGVQHGGCDGDPRQIAPGFVELFLRTGNAEAAKCAFEPSIGSSHAGRPGDHRDGGDLTQLPTEPGLALAERLGQVEHHLAPLGDSAHRSSTG